MSQLTSPVPTVDCNEYFERVLSGGEGETCDADSHHFLIAGERLCVRFSCPVLERQYLPALTHLQQSPCASRDQPTFTINVWGQSQAEEVLLNTPWPEDHDGSSGVECVRSERGCVTLNRDTDVVHLYDRKHHQGSLWVPDVERVLLWDRAAPFFKILNWWLADRGVSLVHAAAVSTPEAAVLIVGKSGSGKSTLALSSLSSGLGCLGDDYVAVRRGEVPMVFSLYNGAKVEPQQLQTSFPQHTQHVHQTGDEFGEKSLIYLAETHPDKLLLAVPLKAILIPRIGDHPQPELSSCGAGEAFRSLAPSTMFQLPGNMREKFAALTQLTREIPAYRLNLSPDLDSNIRLVEQFVKG